MSGASNGPMSSQSVMNRRAARAGDTPPPGRSFEEIEVEVILLLDLHGESQLGLCPALGPVRLRRLGRQGCEARPVRAVKRRHERRKSGRFKDQFLLPVLENGAPGRLFFLPVGT